MSVCIASDPPLSFVVKWNVSVSHNEKNKSDFIDCRHDSPFFSYNLLKDD